MRCQKHDLMRGLWIAAFLFALLITAPSVGAAKAQQQNGLPPAGPRTTVPQIDGRAPVDPNDPMLVQQKAARARAMADDRQKRIVDETAKLLQLATELKSDVDKSSKNELSLDVIRKADDIEKLAHDVKQRMRGQ